MSETPRGTGSELRGAPAGQGQANLLSCCLHWAPLNSKALTAELLGDGGWLCVGIAQCPVWRGPGLTHCLEDSPQMFMLCITSWGRDGRSEGLECLWTDIFPPPSIYLEPFWPPNLWS